jgi:hypothetical protein
MSGVALFPVHGRQEVTQQKIKKLIWPQCPLRLKLLCHCLFEQIAMWIFRYSHHLVLTWLVSPTFFLTCVHLYTALSPFVLKWSVLWPSHLPLPAPTPWGCDLPLPIKDCRTVIQNSASSLVSKYRFWLPRE